jgi:hypothetical protein
MNPSTSSQERPAEPSASLPFRQLKRALAPILSHRRGSGAGKLNTKTRKERQTNDDSPTGPKHSFG